MVKKVKNNKEWKYREAKKEVISEVRRRLNKISGETEDKDAEAVIEDVIFSRNDTPFRSTSELSRLARESFYSVRCELDILTPLIRDDSISEIMVNGADDIYIEKEGRLERSSLAFDSCEVLEEVIRRIAGSVHREINERNPVLDARLSDGSRVNAVFRNIALGGPSLSIRKFPERSLTMSDLIEMGSITEEAAAFLKRAVIAGMNIFVSGGTSSGKTTMLNILSEYIPKEERVVSIEDSAELALHGIENIVRLECRNANTEGRGEINMDELIKTSLRMRPDRIIVGEVRGGECASMLQAMNTGHAGMSTGHANSAEGMLRRMEAMYLQKDRFPLEAVREQIFQGIDIIVHLARIKGIGRKVMEISEISGLRDDKFIINTIFQYKTEHGLVPTGSRIKNREKFELAGMGE